MFLSPDEIHRLTGRTKYKAQIRQLHLRGIPVIPDADGKPLVLCAAVDAILGGSEARSTKTEPDWTTLHASRP